MLIELLSTEVPKKSTLDVFKVGIDLYHHDHNVFEAAYSLANRVHQDQERDDGAPYMTHIDGVILILKEELKATNKSYYSIAALHDVLEDSDTITYDYIKELFGTYIANGVKLLTKTKHLSIQQYLYNMETYEFPCCPISIKLADRLNNVRSLQLIVHSNSDKVKRYITETETFYMPLSKKYRVLTDELEEALFAIKSMLY
jgi:GTP diphosphokinase / guanosine-3',5'-bis(diphosphate) 3'-diphosphatase